MNSKQWVGNDKANWLSLSLSLAAVVHTASRIIYTHTVHVFVCVSAQKSDEAE